MKFISIIAAYSKNRCIGKAGRIPWRIRGEQKLFKELTTGNVVIMGRRTYEEIGRPLPNRMTYLISESLTVEAENCHTVKSLREALELTGGRDAFIAGGGMLYREAIGLADRLYITEIDADIEGDTFFPVFDENEYEVSVSERVKDAELPYTRKIYERKQ